MNLSNLTLQQIHDIGGWTFAALILAAGIYGLVRGMVVPRFLYDEQKARADQAIESQEQVLATIDRLAKSIDMITTALISSRYGGSSSD